MEILTRSVIDISESLASYLLSSYIHSSKNYDVIFEKRLDYVKTGQFSRADIYYAHKDMAIETKSIAHGNDALKGVIQASMYKEQTDQSAFCIQKPHRKALRETLESMCRSYGVGLVYIHGIPKLCSKKNIENATGGCSKPFEIWKSKTYTSTKQKIISNSRSGWTSEYMNTLDQIVDEYSNSIFEFKIEPDSSVQGLSDLHNNEVQHKSIIDF